MPLGRNDPCHCGSGKKYKKCHLAADEAASAALRDAEPEEPDEPAPPPDRRALEAVMRGMADKMGGRPRKRTAADKAQDLMFQAFEERNPERRIALAHEALRVSPDCADAYVLLAEETAATAQEMTSLYQKAVAAAERTLGKAPFEEDVGHFWDILETRPYMRARRGLAECLWATGEREQAIAHFEELLRLNPNDNQGARYLLAPCLLEAGRDEELAALLRRYEEDWSATWAWSAALLAFRRDGERAATRAALAQAMEVNPHVRAYLLGRKKLPRRMPSYYSPGDENEAIEYALHNAAAWKGTPGALEWLAAAERKPSAASPTPPPL